MRVPGRVGKSVDVGCFEVEGFHHPISVNERAGDDSVLGRDAAGVEEPAPRSADRVPSAATLHITKT